MSQPRWSDLERGLGRNASIETWALAAAAVGLQLAAFLEGAPGADRPRDMEHLRRQNALIALSAPGGWSALPEFAVDPAPRSRSIDVALVRWQSRESIVAEIWDWFDDVGVAFRGLGAKTQLLRERLERENPGATRWRVGGLFVVRDTGRNRILVHELATLLAARFPGRSKDWLAALTDRARSMPAADGILWSDSNARLHAARLHAARPQES